MSHAADDPDDRKAFIAAVVDAIWTELERQAETERFGPCIDRGDDLIDGHPDMDAVGEAIATLIGGKPGEYDGLHTDDVVREFLNGIWR